MSCFITKGALMVLLVTLVHVILMLKLTHRKTLPAESSLIQQVQHERHQ